MKSADLSKIIIQEIQKCVPAELVGAVDCGWPMPELGDYSSSIALKAAKAMKKKPIDAAGEIVARLEQSPTIKQYFEKIKVKTPGFINFRIKENFLQSAVEEIIKEKDDFGKGEKKNQKILIEFLSANPTGPMHLGNGRGGFMGDCLSNVLRWAGFEVWKEYYVNDIGNQVVNLGKSIMAASGFYQEQEGEKLYKADYINDLVKTIGPKRDDDLAEIGKQGVAIILKDIQRVARDKMRINFDQWFSEKSLYDDKKIDAIFDWIKKENLVYEKESAVWFASSRFGDDKDRVVIKSNGEKTYMLSDFAYLKDKFDRGFDELITILGADHHGYVSRLQAIVRVLGHSTDQNDFILAQIVRLIENGKEVKMSKRGGTFVTIEELIDETGHDVVRFFFVQRAPETHMDFDLNLAKEHSAKNPVYYVQYAHARICGILKKIQDSNLKIKSLKTADEYAPNSHSRILAAHLIKFPDFIEETARTCAVHHLPAYAIKLADLFHRFYENCRVIEDDEVNEERLKIIKAAQIVLKNVLTVIGVSAPEKM